MSKSDPGAENIFDVDKIRHFVELMLEHDLAEIDLRQGTQRIQLKRGQPPVLSGSAGSLPAQASVAPQRSAESSEDVDGENIVYIKSPMVGTFYLKPSPEADTFIKVGDHVTPDTTVCVIEAMKVFNEIPADVSGRIVAALVENEEPVEFGKQLFKVDTAG